MLVILYEGDPFKYYIDEIELFGLTALIFLASWKYLCLLQRSLGRCDLQ